MPDTKLRPTSTNRLKSTHAGLAASGGRRVLLTRCCRTSVSEPSISKSG